MHSLDEIYVCYHGYDGECEYRKPAPECAKSSKKTYIDLSRSFMIGDRSKDMEAGKAASCKTIFIDYQYSEKLNIHPDYKTNSINNSEIYRKNECFFKKQKNF